MAQTAKPNEATLAQRLAALRPGQEPVTTTLKTSGRVLRRVTDGIYREPWAALRELISNAYDADATQVEVLTDAPWFRRITVRDNGIGFTRDSLASALEHIGGSAKRTVGGVKLGVTASDDPTTSPGGRRLIGKLGIGLFAVSHLSQRFRIITKARKEKYRTVADVILMKNVEETGKGKATADEEFKTTGEASIYCVPADDVDAQGTEIIVEEVLPRTRSEFQGADIWKFQQLTASDEESPPPPAYHIGYPSEGSKSDVYQVPPRLPWQVEATPLQKFEALAQAMFDQADKPGAGRKPSLKTTFDNYFRFVWLLSLGAPVDYIGRHPFDLDNSFGIRFFKLGEIGKQATEIELKDGETLRERLKLRAPERGSASSFRVFVDGIELRRPIRFNDLKGSESVTTPLLFVGSEKPNVGGYDPNRTGGSLEFEGYLLWSNRVVPFDHVGALVRVGDSSGSLFDQTFMNYPVSEQNRKEQVTCEIFALEGLDAALNIDRESFNRSHPHHQFVARWVHDAFRQFANRHKEIGRVARTQRLYRSASANTVKLSTVVKRIVRRRTDGNTPIKVELSDDGTRLFDKTGEAIVLPQMAIYEHIVEGGRSTKRATAKVLDRQLRLVAVFQVLHAAKLLDELSQRQLESLALDLAQVMFYEAK